MSKGQRAGPLNPGYALPGTPFVLAGLLVLAALAIGWRVTRDR